MSDIKDLITVSGSNEVAPEAPVAEIKTETPLTAEEVGNTEGLAVGAPDPDETSEAKSTDEEVAPENPEEKSKEERKEEGSKVERKIGKLNKEKAKEARRADKAEAELNELRKRYAEFDKERSEQDLDSMNFDDRVAKVAEDRYTEKAMQREAEKLQTEITEGSNQSWYDKVNAFKQVAPDYEQVVANLAVSQDIANSIKGMNADGPKVAYAIAKDPELTRRISKASPIDVAMILFELKQQGSPVVQPSVNTQLEASKPLVKATPSTSLTPQQQTKPKVNHPTQMSMEDYIKHRREISTLR
jgi:hypothetical protein